MPNSCKSIAVHLLDVKKLTTRMERFEDWRRVHCASNLSEQECEGKT